jgi:uncharacterized FlaG/YvyC family protein
MDASAIRQTYGAVPVQAVRPESSQQRGSVATELPARQSVGSAWEGSAVRNEASQTAAAMSRMAELVARPTEQRFERDRKTDALVFKRIDPASGEVLMQLPEQSLLDLRAYLRDLEHAAGSSIARTV